MIDRKELLKDLQKVVRDLEKDLLERTESEEVPEVGAWLKSEYQQAKDAERTAHTYKQWLDDFITQVAAAWVLSCVFARFLEDNELVDPPRIAGPDSRLQRARDEHTLFFEDAERRGLTDREYLLDIFDGLAETAAGKELFGEHNPMNSLPNWLGPDAAGELLKFFQKIDSDSGELVHDFTDHEWNTRFLGDLYQDLSERARKKYALLQTPDFVEEFILDRTLEPALDEFGLQPESAENNLFKMIDPACGSGHFLLGSFPRILDRWQKEEPGTNIRVLVQRTLDSIHGVDINPFAIAIARFRLLLASLAACGLKRLADAPAFEMKLACGDSLYHGVELQHMLGNWTDESHFFHAEDATQLLKILRSGTFHCSVANPPYILAKDKAANAAYRRLYKTCHLKYSLALPFLERLIGLLVPGSVNGTAGYSGQITANSFMKREFGKKLIETFIPKIDLTHVIDLAGGGGAHIPGHTTPTVLLFARNRKPVSDMVRTVMGIHGDHETPSDPAQGEYWCAMLSQLDSPGSTSEYLSVADVLRETFSRHPWSISGGGTAELKEALDQAGEARLGDVVDAIGPMAMTMLDEVFLAPRHTWRKLAIPYRSYVTGDCVRDWDTGFDESIANPYDADLEPIQLTNLPQFQRHSWKFRLMLDSRLMFGKTPVEAGLKWYEYRYIEKERAKTVPLLLFACVATHNHFDVMANSFIANRHAPVIKLRNAGDALYKLLGLLNSSVACFWMKQVFYPKATSTGDVSTKKGKPEANRFEFASKGLAAFPLPFSDEKDEASLVAITKEIVAVSEEMRGALPSAIVQAFDVGQLKNRLNAAQARYKNLMERRITLQEELDWEVYWLFGITPNGANGSICKEDVRVRPSDRPFLWRKDFETEVLPAECRVTYKFRNQSIRENAALAILENAMFKRPWLGRQGVYGRHARDYDGWKSETLFEYLLDRLEGFFDFDGRMTEKRNANAKFDIGLTSVAKLADTARQDEQFMEVAEVYRDDPAFDVQKLVEELVKGEHVPLLPVLRYKPNGLRNRVEWEKTWGLQRLEDKLRGEESADLGKYELTNEQVQAITKWQTDTPAKQKAEDRDLDKILSIPVPPKYKSSDFISTGGARYWALRGKLDVPKERWVSFPHCEGPDGTLVIAWAGYNHLQLAQAISAYYVEVQERLGGGDDARLVPLLGGIIELLPWLKQWHGDLDPEYNQRMDEVFDGFVIEEAKNLGMTTEEISSWQPPQTTSRRKRKTSNSK